MTGSKVMNELKFRNGQNRAIERLDHGPLGLTGEHRSRANHWWRDFLRNDWPFISFYPIKWLPFHSRKRIIGRCLPKQDDDWPIETC